MQALFGGESKSNAIGLRRVSSEAWIQKRFQDNQEDSEDNQEDSEDNQDKTKITKDNEKAVHGFIFIAS